MPSIWSYRSSAALGSTAISPPCGPHSPQLGEIAPRTHPKASACSKCRSASPIADSSLARPRVDERIAGALGRLGTLAGTAAVDVMRFDSLYIQVNLALDDSRFERRRTATFRTPTRASGCSPSALISSGATTACSRPAVRGCSRSPHHPSCFENLGRPFAEFGITTDRIGTTFNVFLNGGSIRKVASASTRQTRHLATMSHCAPTSTST